jgi:hypothetical protein
VASARKTSADGRINKSQGWRGTIKSKSGSAVTTISAGARERVPRRHYLLEHDFGGAPTIFPMNDAGLQAAIRTAESHVGQEFFISLGRQAEKALCKRVDIWRLNKWGRKLELITTRTDGRLQGGTAPVRGRASGLAERSQLSA